MKRSKTFSRLLLTAALVTTAGACQVDFLGGNDFVCVGERIQSSCLAGYLCNQGRCVRDYEYQPPPPDVGPKPDVPDVHEAPDIPPEVPDIPVPDIPTVDDLRGDSCQTDEDCARQRTGLVCSAEKVCCDAYCDSECRSCLLSIREDQIGRCLPRPRETPCGGENSDCNECNAAGQCMPRLEERCDLCSWCTVPPEGNRAACTPVPEGGDPFQQCGDHEACGGKCNGSGECDLAAAAGHDEEPCGTCRECNNGRCVAVADGTEDAACGDAVCGAACVGGGCPSAPVLAEEDGKKCATCHWCQTGRCEPLEAGRTDAACADENPCGRTGTCAANGQCAIRPVGLACQATTCTDTLRTTWACDVAQTCVATQSDCTPFTCEEDAEPEPVCRETCGFGKPCAADFYCAGSICQQKQDLGTACLSADACRSGHCVDGVCCDDDCNGLCEVCVGVPAIAAAGTCAIAEGLNPETVAGSGVHDCDGQLDPCDGVCKDIDGMGRCDYGDSVEERCGTCKYCSPAGNGQCVNRPAEPRHYGDCQGDEECGGYCEAGSCVGQRPSGAACGDGPCAVCTAAGSCGLAQPGADPKGLCPGDAACGGGCQADGTCGTIDPDGSLCGSDGQPCFWCRAGSCALIADTETPAEVCGAGDDPCRSRCTSAGQCGPPVPPGTDCGLTCHRCDGAGSCALMEPGTEPASECPGDGECGARCEATAGGCGLPRPAGEICKTGDGCSTCQEFLPGDFRCLARTDTPDGTCEGEDPLCNGHCGLRGVCVWPGQEEWCAECHRCDAAGGCVPYASPAVSLADCGGDDPACAGDCLGGACDYRASDGEGCGGDGAVCQTCDAGGCVFVEAGEDPLGDCNPVDHPVCGETCDGAGGCEAAPGPDTGEPVACGGTCQWCDGLGACVPVPDFTLDPHDTCEADQVCVSGSCTTCGNGVKEPHEICDPLDPDHPCEGLCASDDACIVSAAIGCRCVDSPVTEADDVADGCCPPIAERHLDPDCIRWTDPPMLNPDPFQPFTFAQIPAVDPDTGTLYIGGRSTGAGTVPLIYALSPDGEVLWTASTASEQPMASAATSSPVFVGGKLYFGRSTWLVSLDTVTRQTRDVVNLFSLVKEPPVLASSGLLVVGTADGRLHAVNPVDRTVRWTYDTGAGTLAGPGTRAGTYVYWGTGGAIHHVNLFDPPEIIGSSVCYTAAAALGAGGVSPGSGGSLYLGDTSGTVRMLYAAAMVGLACTEFNSDSATVSGHIDATPLTLGDGSVLFGGHDPDLNPNPGVGLFARSPDLSELRWSEALGGHVRFTPLVGTGPAGDRVYVALRQVAGVRIVAINPGLGGDTQGVDWVHDYAVPGAPGARLSSALSIGPDGSLYFRTNDGSLNAIVTDSRGLAETGWPKHYGDAGNTGNPP